MEYLPRLALWSLTSLEEIGAKINMAQLHPPSTPAVILASAQPKSNFQVTHFQMNDILYFYKGNNWGHLFLRRD